MRFAPLIAAASLLALPAHAGTTVTYTVDGEAYEGYLAEATRDSKGLVIVIHDWDGLDGYEETRAEMIADQGYDAFAIDLYGKGNRPQDPADKMGMVRSLYEDRETMRARITEGLKIAREQTGETRIVVMGYCFGGGATLDLARAGDDKNVIGFVSFHGSLDTPEGQSYSGDEAPILILHGGADRGIPNALVASVADEMEAAGTPYELVIYSGAPHAWTKFGSDAYRAEADEKSWERFSDFLHSQFALPDE